MPVDPLAQAKLFQGTLQWPNGEILQMLAVIGFPVESRLIYVGAIKLVVD